MKRAKCLQCGEWFVQYRTQDHTCESCDGAVDEHDEREGRNHDAQEQAVLNRAVCKMCDAVFIQHHPADLTCAFCVDPDILALARNPGSCVTCGAPYEFVCEWRLTDVGEHLELCEAKLCALHRVRFGGRGLCPEHAQPKLL